ncbi:uncharacterized protein Dwil_GK12167 [Drosophila willistoni]|uniref:RRM domain-containing protein n=1 Tax=Drosophila willistoni TaxID=7260 RepID=B4N965_DROWI|nr:DNA-binding protein modulo [Drosophila willistoni]EDW81612.2 uncharacterized protein Dwil_GK12167 [Drosophila willistoni]
MALKKVAAASKQVKKQPVAKPNKRGPKAKALDEEVVATQTPTKKGKKQPIPQAEPSDEESEASEEENGVEGSDSEGEDEGQNGLIDSQAEEDDDEEDEDDDDGEANVTKPIAASDDDESESDDDEDEDDEEEPGEIKPGKVTQKADSDDEAPVEAPIAKKEKKVAKKETESKEEEDETNVKKGGIPRIKISRIPRDTPKNQIVFVSNFPAEFKHIDLVALFTKFGPISVVNRIKTHSGTTIVQIAFETPEGADAAVDAQPKALTLNDNVLVVSRPFTRKETNALTVVVGLFGPLTTKTDLHEYFSKCGEINCINMSQNRTNPTAYVRFEAAESKENALKLHGTELNNRFITVKDEADKKVTKTSECTITVENPNKLESYNSNTVEKIFKKYGELAGFELLCTASIFAFVTYKEAASAEKAKNALNNKTVGDLELKISNYVHQTSARTILVKNLAYGVSEDDLKTLFGKSGEIESIQISNFSAQIKFKTDDGFCKSFLLNDLEVANQPIFIEPHSLNKSRWMRQTRPETNNAFSQNKFNKFGNSNGNHYNKRPAPNHGGGRGGMANMFKKARKF